MKKSFWSIDYTPVTLITIPASVAVNYIGKFIAGLFGLPLWLDSVGTIAAGLIIGPLGAVITGVIDNIIYGLTIDPFSYAYAITSVAIGITVGVLVRLNLIQGIWRSVIAGIAIAGVASVVSMPINVYFWGGLGGNSMGDAIFVKLAESGFHVWLASLIAGLAIDIPDKILSVLLAVGILNLAGKNAFAAIFPGK